MVRYGFNGRCEDSPTRAHHYVKLVGSIWRCKYCWAVMWLPADLRDATKFSADISRLGFERGYSRQLSFRPKTRDLLTKLDEIRLLKKVLPDDQLSFAIAAIINGKAAELEDTRTPDPEYNNCLIGTHKENPFCRKGDKL